MGEKSCIDRCVAKYWQVRTFGILHSCKSEFGTSTSSSSFKLCINVFGLYSIQVTGIVGQMLGSNRPPMG